MVEGEGGRRVWKIVHSIVLATLLCMTADQVSHWLKQEKYIYCQFYKAGEKRLQVTRKLHRKKKWESESSMSIKIDDVTNGCGFT